MSRDRWRRVPRITGQLLTQETHPCGRLVPPEDFRMDEYDYKERVGVFLVPSLSRVDRVYGVELDWKSGEVACRCEALYDFREASNMPYSRERAGLYLESLARTRNVIITTLITRDPRHLCPHARKVRAFLLRHKLLGYFVARVQRATERMEALAA